MTDPPDLFETKSRGQLIREEIAQLTEPELRQRLLSAEYLIYVLEARLADLKGSDPRGPLHGQDLYDLMEDEKEARAAYVAARENPK